MSYQIVMAEPAWDRFWEYVSICPGEVAAFGYCKPENDGFVYVEDLFLVPQEADGSQVDFITEGLPYAVKKAVEDDRAEDLRFCIHSHAQHGAQWSSTDEDMIEKIGSTGTPWFASAIFNKAGKSAGRVDLFAGALGALPGMKQATVEAAVVCESKLGLYEECLAEVEQFVKKPKPKTLTAPKNRPAGKQSQPSSPPPLNVADLIEFDDDFVLDMKTYDVYRSDFNGRLQVATDTEEAYFWEKVYWSSESGTMSEQAWHQGWYGGDND